MPRIPRSRLAGIIATRSTVRYSEPFEGFYVSQATTPCVLVVADPGRIRELTDALVDPLPIGGIEVVTSTGGDDTIELFQQKKPEVIVLAASLEHGDSKSLIEVFRDLVPANEIGIVLVGDEEGPLRTALDAIDLHPDRFLTRPLAAKALRFAIESCIEQVALVRGSPRTTTDRGTGVHPTAPAPVNGAASEDDASRRAALRARWEALADSITDEDLDDADPTDAGEAAPLPPPIVIQPRRTMGEDWQPGNTSELRDDWDPGAAAPSREPTLILPPHRDSKPSFPPPEIPSLAARARIDSEPPMPLADLIDRQVAIDDELAELDHHLAGVTPPPHVIRGGELRPLDDFGPIEPAPASTPPPLDERGPRDFARALREKMSQMAQRLFQADASAPSVDVAPHHDHQTEIDLASLGEEPPLRASVTEIEGAARLVADMREQLTTSPGTWDTQVRERGLPDSGEIVRGVSDAAMLLARMFAQGATGRLSFRKDDNEKVVYFDQGRPVFAASNEPGDRMGELLVREGKITAAQYERCQAHATTSGRRMGEILVDFGYLKRRELLPAVRRHVEDIIYSLFGWDHGHYRVHVDTSPSAERIRLSRHPASLILEGVRRKLDRTALERLVGPPSTVVEVPDRERLGGIVNLGDLAAEERAALAAFDGQADLAHVARTANIDVADVLPLAWGLSVLGLATSRRVEADAGDEATALVGETDLAIDRERVRARWELVGEADYFALLGVRRDATAFEIRRAYQSARRDFAADCFPSDLRRELARELDDIASVLDEAFRVLRDDRLRVTYLANLVD